MRILVIADSKLPVPPEGYGGAERIIALLCEGFATRGHRVTLMAAAGSRNYGRLVTYPWAGRQARVQRAWARGVFTARALVEAARGQDVILSNARTDWLTPLLRLGMPLVYRFGNPIGADQVAMLRRHARGPLRMISVSDAQRTGFGGEDWRTIYNAVDVSRLPFSAQGRDGYLAFLGRLTANKGVDTAIRAARRAGLPLRIAGNVSDEEGGRAFFEREVAPHLGDGVEWVGELETSRMHDLAETVNVDVTTVEACLAARGWDSVDLVKIDIEGAEEALLTENNAWLARAAALIMEIHPACSEALIAAAIAPFGFALKRHGTGREPVFLAIKK